MYVNPNDEYSLGSSWDSQHMNFANGKNEIEKYCYFYKAR